MKIGISAFAWTSRFGQSHIELLQGIRELGIHGVEIPMFDPVALPVYQIREAVEKNGLECTVCAILPKEFNPINPEQQTRRRAVEHLVRCIGAAEEMGAKLLGGPLFAPIGYLPEHRPTKDEWGWAVEALQALGDVVAAKNMQISIEPVNRSETFFLRTAEDARLLCELIGNPRIGVTIDTFHSNIEEHSISGAIKSLGQHLRHVHASENDRGPLGRGHIPFDDIVATLKEMNYQGYVMIEGFGYRPDLKDGPGYLWANTDISPELLLSESAAFLTNLLAIP